MTKTMTNLIGILITILAGTYFYITCCSECGPKQKEVLVEEVVAAPVIPDATPYPFAISDGDFSVSANDNFNFNISSSDILTPVSQKIIDGVGSLKAYLAENPGREINIIGYYAADETNDTAYPNLGLARANAVKNYFVSQGIASKLINTSGELKEGMFPKENVYLGPLGYGIDGEAEGTSAQLSALYNTIKANPLVLYFNTGEASIQLTPEQRQKVADISRYLDKVDGASINIVGHTDNTGNRATNQGLGLERADFAKRYFMRNGISDSKANTSSKGQDEPLGTNETEEGKALNRRTVVTLN